MLVLTRKTQETVVVGGSANFEQLLKVTVFACLGTFASLERSFPDRVRTINRAY